ncbi:MAG: rod shape-determining protein [Halanaerobiales bacterium]|nr:rod shape-determining protein [Halanaerobiales bacterium]
MVNENLLFALDIGTRTVVGLVLTPTPEGLEIIASEVLEHENRAMLDGQIHNVIEVARVVQEIKTKLEEKIGQKLTKTAVAAAGRALKTVKQTHYIELSQKREITAEDINTLELAAVQIAQKTLAKEEIHDPTDYHFVGYSVITYRLDDMHLGNLIGQKGKKIEVDLIVTFLPRIVIDSLITVIQHADLTVHHMTLEPIAASNVVIPKEMHNFNLALVDIGAGTSDIAITQGGAIVAYAMVPVAGDEITEALAEHYLLDYATSEKLKRSITSQEKIEIKDILGSTLEIESHEALLVLKRPVEELAKLIGDEILALNQKSPQAVLCIGGGSLSPFITQKLAEKLQLPSNRVGVKQAIDIKGIKGEIPNLTSTQAVTPIGIAVTCNQNANTSTFIDIKLNGERIDLFSLGVPTVSDALLSSNYGIQNLYGRPGMALTIKVNGKLKTIKGTMGQLGLLEVNGESATYDTPIQNDDEIIFEPGKDGKPGFALVQDVVEFTAPKTIFINKAPHQILTQILMNDKSAEPETPVIDRAEIKVITTETYRKALLEFMEVPATALISREILFSLNDRQISMQIGKYDIKINGEYIDLDMPISDGSKIKITPLSKDKLTIEDLQQQNNQSLDIEVTFNGRNLSIPTNHWEIRRNYQEVTIDTKIENGDNIICRPKPISFNHILNFINYKVPDSLSNRLVITINGKDAKFTDYVNNGDVLELKI